MPRGGVLAGGEDDEQRMGEHGHAGRPEAEVLIDLKRVHDETGLQLDPSGGAQLAQRISETKPEG